MPEVVFIADDFGLSRAVNRAVARAYEEGALHGASLMLGQPGTEEAVVLARAHPELPIGWHLHLCDSVPVTRSAWPWGASPVRAGLALACWPPARRLARAEILGQWQRFRATGLECQFVNAHHHLHVHPFVLRALGRALGTEFRGWTRGFAVRRFPGSARRSMCGVWPLGPHLHRRLRNARQGRVSDHLWGLDRTFAMRAEEVRAVLAAPEEGLHEFVFHPRGDAADADTAALLALGPMRGRGGRCGLNRT